MSTAHERVNKITTTEEFKEELGQEIFDFRFDCGYSEPITIADKDDFIYAIWVYYVFFHPHAELHQLRKGFKETLQMELLLLTHGKHVHNLLAISHAFDPTPTFLIDGVVIHYSLEGSNNRTKRLLFYIGQIMSLL